MYVTTSPAADPAPTTAEPRLEYVASLALDYDSATIRAMPRGVARRTAAVGALEAAEQAAVAAVAPRLEQLRQEGLLLGWSLLPRTGTLMVTTSEARSGAAWQALLGVSQLDTIVRDYVGVQVPPPPPPRSTRRAHAGVDLPWSLDAIGAPAAWETGARGQGITIGFVDSGADVSHPMLQSRFRGNQSGEEYSYVDLLDRKPGIRDTYGHGTIVTSVAVGSGSDGTIGPAPQASFMSARAFGRAADGAPGTLATKLAGIAWMLAPTRADGSAPDPAAAPDIVNLSFGEGASKAAVFAPMLRALEDAGVLVVAAAGNGGRRGPGSVLSPAVLDTVVAVGMTRRDGTVDDRSGRDTPSSPPGAIKPDIVAPGVDLPAASMHGGYVTASGTSFASAVVAGAAAVVLSAAPHLTPAQVRDVLRRSAADIGAPGSDPLSGAGRLDVEAAVRLARTIPKEAS